MNNFKRLNISFRNFSYLKLYYLEDGNCRKIKKIMQIIKTLKSIKFNYQFLWMRNSNSPTNIYLHLASLNDSFSQDIDANKLRKISEPEIPTARNYKKVYIL